MQQRDFILGFVAFPEDPKSMFSAAATVKCGFTNFGASLLYSIHPCLRQFP